MSSQLNKFPRQMEAVREIFRTAGGKNSVSAEFSFKAFSAIMDPDHSSPHMHSKEQGVPAWLSSYIIKLIEFRNAAHMEQEESLVWSYLVSFTGLGLKSSLGSRLGPIKTSNRT
ncbi:uncharacterized protein LOC135332582 [Halichondria panicea]|uniref:uncharacterized protein LOC135332582 n=1 Tax=Halichondria panicea TaxID=6063 RepID=UPI00312B386E